MFNAVRPRSVRMLARALNNSTGDSLGSLLQYHNFFCRIKCGPTRMCSTGMVLKNPMLVVFYLIAFNIITPRKKKKYVFKLVITILPFD